MSEVRVEKPLFRIRGLSAQYDGRTVLEVDELELAEGKITVLVGENGSGKTTLLRALNGLKSPSAGSIDFRGMPLSGEGLRAVRDQSVLVHQSPLLFRGSVGYNVAFGLHARRKSRGEISAEVRRALRLVGLAGFERRRAGGLSGGEKQRVALARALALSAPVLLLDEPTANVDPESRPGIEALLRDGSVRSGTTLIMASHDRPLGYRLSDRLLRLEAGRLAPLDENILRGFVEASDEQVTWFRTGRALIQSPARTGPFEVAVIPLDEVVLSREHLHASTRNQLDGTVVRVEAASATATGPAGGLLRVLVDCGAAIEALITRAAATELGVAAGAACVVSFKASAVRLY